MLRNKSEIAGVDKVGEISRRFRADEEPMRSPDEPQISHKPRNGDKHTPVSPVGLPPTPLNDCKH